MEFKIEKGFEGETIKIIKYKNAIETLTKPSTELIFLQILGIFSTMFFIDNLMFKTKSPFLYFYLGISILILISISSTKYKIRYTDSKILFGSKSNRKFGPKYLNYNLIEGYKINKTSISILYSIGDNLLSKYTVRGLSITEINQITELFNSKGIKVDNQQEFKEKSKNLLFRKHWWLIIAFAIMFLALAYKYKYLN